APPAPLPIGANSRSIANPPPGTLSVCAGPGATHRTPGCSAVTRSASGISILQPAAAPQPAFCCSAATVFVPLSVHGPTEPSQQAMTGLDCQAPPVSAGGSSGASSGRNDCPNGTPR